MHPFFWLLSAILGWPLASQDPKLMLIWMAAVFVSILVHEMGHALVIRYYGWSPSVILYSFGGLATYNPGFRPVNSSYSRNGNTTLGQIAISFAGPAAGFLLALIVAASVIAAGYKLDLDLVIRTEAPPEPDLPPGTLVRLYTPLAFLANALLWINIYWGILNLVPVYPLDGGKISREICLAVNSREGLKASMIISLIASGCVALYAFKMGQPFLAIMFAMFGFSTYQQLSGGNRYGGGRPW